MGYLFCTKCEGEFELNPGENSKNFIDKCDECGGKLKYLNNNLDSESNSSENNTSTSQIVKIGNNYCPNCGYNKSPNAEFCKNCGVKFYQEENNFIIRFNNRINLLAVILGILVSVIVLFIGTVLYGSLVASGSLSLIMFISLVLFSMSLIGGVITGILGSDNASDGMINGGFLSLILLINLGFIVGVVWFVFVGVASSFANSLNTYASGALSSSTALNNTSTSNIFGSWQILIEFIIILSITFIGGVIGGGLGALMTESSRD